jgi:hypothetical protein
MWKRYALGENVMKNKIGFGAWIIVALLSLAVIPSILLSIFVFPVEMILFNEDSYSEILDGEEFLDQLPPVVADVASNQVLLIGDIPPVLSNRNNFQAALEPYLQDEWVRAMASELVGGTLDYFNFNTPYAAIANSYIQSLESCQGQNAQLVMDASTLYEYPACKPEGDKRAELSAMVAVFLEDRTANLPGSINLVGLVPQGMLLGESAFYWYSIMRWGFRLLPFFAILALILISYLLRKNKKSMRGWVGWVLAGTSGLLLVASLVILVGLDQFIGLLLNRHLSLLIAGFGNILLSIVHIISNKMLLWVIAISAVIFLFGLVLLLAAKYAKSEKAIEHELEPASDLATEGAGKEIIPQTIEEIEQEEKENGPVE